MDNVVIDTNSLIMAISSRSAYHKIWLNQQQMAELFATSKQTISYHIINILKEKELSKISVVKEYLTTAADGKNYNVVFRKRTSCKARAPYPMRKQKILLRAYMTPSTLIENSLTLSWPMSRISKCWKTWRKAS